jgi:hypothetical protein
VVRPGAGASTFPSGRFFGTMILMGTQETVQPKKRRGPAPTGHGTPVQVRLQPDQLAPLDAWIAAQPDPKPSRPEAIRLAVLDWLTGQGYVRLREDPEMGN